ncbi:hypothetical protein FSP39_018756 [Pinctada imbricata]|uniref:Glutamate [NMDA] receptor subunit 1 n=1 Tax=Pinctada imbricata TaxID=66713 RepID=A0AA88Y4K1_PINIB|nr:hypothetical protein FSP39_018756 [Pinctada imbricata]
MGAVSFLVFGLVLTSVPRTAHSLTTFRIAGVLSSNYNGKVLQDAIAKLNRNTDKSYDLEFEGFSIIMDSNPIRSALNLCKLVIPKEVQTIIVSKPRDEESSSPISVSYTCGFYQIPVIGISARDSAFSDSRLHPTFLRTVPPYFHQADIWVEMLEHFNLTQVIFIHSMDEEGRMILSRFQAKADQKDITIEKVIKYPSGAANYTSVLEPVLDQQSRVILLSANTEDADKIFENAKTLNLTVEGYVWIVSEEALSAVNIPVGVLGLQLINGTNEEVHIQDSVKLVGNAISKLFQLGNLTSISNTPNNCSKPHKTWRDGKTILDALKYEKISGITGQVSFNNDGDRLNPLYFIKNVQPANKITEIGYYGNKQVSSPYIDIDNSKIIWAGGSRTIPDGIKISRHLKVVTLQYKPFVWTRLSPDGTCHEDRKERLCPFYNATTGNTTNYCCYGYCIEMLIDIAESVNFTFSLHQSPSEAFGSYKKKAGSNEKEWNGMIGEVIRGESDMIVAPLTINPERADFIDFSKPFKYQGLTILVKKTPKNSNLASFLQPFQDTLWILVGLSVHVVALVLYLLDRFSPFGRFKLAKNNDTEEDALNLSSAMWFAWGVLLNSGIGEGTPRSFSARVLGMIWAGFAMIIVASYTANLAAFLVLDRPEASITGIDDARLRNPNEKFRFATVKNSAVEMYFKRQVELSTMYRQMESRNYDTADVAIKAVQNDDLEAFIWDSSRLEYEAANNCSLITAGELFGRSGLGIGLRKKSPWTEKISMAILKLHENGTMENLDNRWILKESDDCPDSNTAPATLGLTNMAGVFMMVAGGIVAGVFLIFIEIAYKWHRGLKEKELELARNAADRWRGNIEKRRTLRQTLQRQREEQQTQSQQVKQTPEGNGTAGGEGHFPGHRLSYTEATGSKLYTPPPTLPKPNRSITINNPTFQVEQQDDNIV